VKGKLFRGDKPPFHDVSSPKGVSAYSSKLLSFQTQGFKRKEGKRTVFLFLLSLPSTNPITTCKTNLLGGQKCLAHSTTGEILIKGKEGPCHGYSHYSYIQTLSRYDRLNSGTAYTSTRSSCRAAVIFRNQ